MTSGVIDDVASGMLSEEVGHLPVRVRVYEADGGGTNIAAPVSAARRIAALRPQKTRCSMLLLPVIGFSSSAHNAESIDEKTINQAGVQVART